MKPIDGKAIAEREERWREFHRWEQSQTNRWTLPERLAWYDSTLDLARLFHPREPDEGKSRIERIQHRRRRLSLLKVR